MANTSPKFPIPHEFEDDLRFSPCADTRSDAEILSSLNQHVPVSSEKNIWAFWHSGILTMPEWQQRNVAQWIRKCDSSWTIRVLDNVPGSPNHAFKYFAPYQVPACYRDGTMDGPYARVHASDFARGACLYNHGGVWTDVGQVLLMSLEQICWNKLEDPNAPFRICAPYVSNCMIANYFIAARKEDPFIKRWCVEDAYVLLFLRPLRISRQIMQELTGFCRHEVFCALWEGKTNYLGVMQHPLLKDLEMGELWDPAFAPNLRVSMTTLMEYTAQMTCWVRICMIEGSDTGGDSFNGAEYWLKHVLLIEAMAETLGASEAVGWEGGGPRMFDLLCSKVDADPSSQVYKDAYRAVWRVLTKSSTVKNAGSGMLKTANLGSIWSRPENRGSDMTPGTFAELLRYGATNFRQTRKGPVYVDAPIPKSTVKKGHLEP